MKIIEGKEKKGMSDFTIAKLLYRDVIQQKRKLIDKAKEANFKEGYNKAIRDVRRFIRKEVDDIQKYKIHGLNMERRTIVTHRMFELVNLEKRLKKLKKK